MKIPFKQLALATSIAGAMAAVPARATYNAGDLVLFFQQFGSTNTVAVNLGSAITFRDTAVNLINIANINAQLSDGTLGFGPTWYNASNVWWGAAAARSASPNTTSQVNGDPNRTLYISQVRTPLGTEGTASSTGWTVDSTGSMTTAATAIIAQNSRLGTSATSVLVEPTSTSSIDDKNPFNPITGVPAQSFDDIFPGSVMGNFGAGTLGNFGGVEAEAALDLYRVLATSNPVGTVIDPGNVNLTGNFQGSFVIDQGGSISYIVQPVPEPSSAVLLGSAALLGGFIRRRKATV